MVPERLMEPESKLNRAHGVHDNPVSGNHQALSHCKNSGNTGYLTSSQRGMGGLGEKLNEHHPGTKNTPNDLTSKAEL